MVEGYNIAHILFKPPMSELMAPSPYHLAMFAGEKPHKSIALLPEA